jgi:hypothetical protein
MAPQPAELSFRENLSQFRWARGNTDDSPQAQQQQRSGGAFSRFYNAVGLSGYVPLRSNERSNEEEAYFALSRWERYVLHFLAKRSTILVQAAWQLIAVRTY